MSREPLAFRDRLPPLERQAWEQLRAAMPYGLHDSESIDWRIPGGSELGALSWQLRRLRQRGLARALPVYPGCIRWVAVGPQWDQLWPTEHP